MDRVAVIASSPGAGRTTLARRLAEIIGAPFVELDALYWGPLWKSAAPEPDVPRGAEAPQDDLAKPVHAHLEVARLRSPKEAAAWLSALRAQSIA